MRFEVVNSPGYWMLVTYLLGVVTVLFVNEVGLL